MDRKCSTHLRLRCLSQCKINQRLLRDGCHQPIRWSCETDRNRPSLSRPLSSRNPRLNDAAVDAVAKSLQDSGFRRPIVVDAEGVIVCGHTGWKASAKLGLA